METYYLGNPNADQANRSPLPELFHNREGRSEQYLASDGLSAAVNIAISLGQPLLLTGEPGCGKTQFAESLADELNLPLLRFNTKSTSTARDLLYNYDAVAHFQNNQNQSLANNKDDNPQLRALPFIRLQGLGLAIVNSNPCPPFITDEHPPQRSVLLIDEVDKASRDFPNDLLHELDRMSFSIAELGGQRFHADARYAPIVVITSNSERHLPDAFLRRCSYFHIDFPSDDVLRKIVLLHLKGFSGRPLLESSIQYFTEARSSGLGKNPGISELIKFLEALKKHNFSLDKSLFEQSSDVSPCLGVLFKNTNDLEIGKALLDKR